MRINKKLLQKAKKIKLIGMDIDGVLTQGELIVLDSGEELKIWDIKDRFAFTMLKRFTPEIELAWISGRDSKQIQTRAKEFGVKYLYGNCLEKGKAMSEIMSNNNLKPDEVAYVGDDFLDAAVFKIVGLSVAPSDAPKELKKIADYVTKARGGKGAFREFVELILKSKGLWPEVLKAYSIK